MEKKAEIHAEQWSAVIVDHVTQTYAYRSVTGQIVGHTTVIATSLDETIALILAKRTEQDKSA